MAAEAFDDFLKSAWAEHGDQPQRVADRLVASLSMVQSPGQVRPYAGLVAHVYGEHLGRWQDGIALLEALRALPANDGSAAVTASVARSIATLRHASGDRAAIDTLAAPDRVAVLAGAAAMFTGRGQLGAAIAAYTRALQLAEGGLPADAPAVRALAIGGNNLAQALEGKPDADAAELAAMVTAAEGGLTFWKQAGTWLEEERAEYRLTRSLLKAGRPREAIASAQRCIDVCHRNAAPAFEQFFGETVLALAHRAAGNDAAFATHRQRALDLLAQLPEDQRGWCARERAELG